MSVFGLSGHSGRRDECPLLGAKQTSIIKGAAAANDPTEMTELVTAACVFITRVPISRASVGITSG
jgi:hypothetical protein